MTHPRNHFADSYTEARRKFLAAAKNADAVLGEYRHPLPGPCGEALFTDTALLRNPGAERLVIVSSGVHGVEGFCGSACQVALLRGGLLAGAESCAILLLHAVSPLATLERGYAILFDADGQVLRSAQGVAIDKRLRARLADGELPLRVDKG